MTFERSSRKSTPTRLRLVHPAADVLRGQHGVVPGVGHEPSRAEHAAEGTDLAHQLPLRERDIEVGEPTLDALDQLVAAHLVGAGLDRCVRCLAFGEDRDAHVLADAVRQHDGATDRLVSVAAVEAGLEVQLHGLVELGGRVFA